MVPGCIRDSEPTKLPPPRAKETAFRSTFMTRMGHFDHYFDNTIDKDSLYIGVEYIPFFSREVSRGTEAIAIIVGI